MKGYGGRVLSVDLSTGVTRIEMRKDLSVEVALKVVRFVSTDELPPKT